MNAHQYRAAREELGWTHARMAKQLGVSLRASYRYASGDTPIPDSIAILVRGYVRDRLTMSAHDFEQRTSEL
jgi:hypothetical protein